MATARASGVSLLLFGSGLTALVYQVCWMRELRLVFGFSTAASAAVVAIFMGGLGIGGWLLGRRADQAPRPLAFYGLLELGVAASAAVTPALLWLVRVAYIAVGGSLSLGLAGGTLARLLLSALVLAVPTVLMGGTLPAATRAVESDADPGRRLLALLYGFNTLGAVAGTLLSTFSLLEKLGTRETLWAACAVNALVGLAALLLSRREPAAAPAESQPQQIHEPAASPGAGSAQGGGKKKRKKRRRDERRAAPTESRPTRPAEHPTRFVLAAAAITGFAFTLMELVWYRMLAPLLGGSTYTFGLILAVALLGIGAGALARSSRAASGTLAGFAATCAIEGALLALPYALGDSVAVLAARLHSMGTGGFGTLVLGWTAVAALVVFPAAFVAGLQFPILISLLGRGREKVGAHVGLAYAWNTAGAIFGSLAGGFGLLPLLTAPGAWVSVALLLAALAIAALLLSARREEGTLLRRAIPLGAASACVALLTATGPTAVWRHSPIGAGRVKLAGASPNRIQEWKRDVRRSVVWEADGVESSVALLRTSTGVAFSVNGKVDGNSRGDAATQVMGGLIGAALHREPRRALVIGLGTGSTAGWLAAVPSIERVDVVELEAAILRVAEACAPVNRNVLASSKVRVSIGDAREYLLASRESYDIIFSEPSNPYRAGVSSLFTEEFYRAARKRLASGGVFLQWLQTYEVDLETVRTVYATLASVLPDVESWFARRHDLILAARTAAPAYDVDFLRARLSEEPFASAMSLTWGTAGLEGFLSHFIARSSFVPRLLAGDPPPRNTDDRNIIEFAFARTLGKDTAFDPETLSSRARGEDTPVLSGGRVDWDRVKRWRVSTLTAQGLAPPVGPDKKGEELLQSQAQNNFLEGHLDVVLEHWRAQPWTPVGFIEIAVVAQALANAGDESAAAYIDLLRETRPVEAAMLLAQLRWRQGRLAEATDLYGTAFARYREDPWPLFTITKGVFAIVADIAGRDRGLAARLENALAQPFALSILDEERLQTRYKVATYLDQSKLEDAIAALEPEVPWHKGILSRRARLYEATRNPRAALARREFDSFVEHESAASAPAPGSPPAGTPVADH